MLSQTVMSVAKRTRTMYNLWEIDAFTNHDSLDLLASLARIAENPNTIRNFAPPPTNASSAMISCAVYLGKSPYSYRVEYPFRVGCPDLDMHLPVRAWPSTPQFV